MMYVVQWYVLFVSCVFTQFNVFDLITKSMICKHIHYVALKTCQQSTNSEDITILSAADTENTNFDAPSNKGNEIQVHIKTLENKKQ